MARFKRPLKWLGGIALGLVLLQGLASLWWWLGRIPDTPIPTPAVPSPNGFDFYAQAGKAVIHAKPAVDQTLDTEIVPQSQWKTRYSTARKEAWLKQNARALSLFRKGLQTPCRVPPIRSDASQMLAGKAQFRTAARMIRIQSKAQGERGNWLQAADSGLDILQMGHDAARGGAIIDFLVGAAMNSIGTATLWPTVSHLNGDQAKIILQRLDKIDRSYVAYADVLREDKYQTQAFFKEQFNQPFYLVPFILYLIKPEFRRDMKQFGFNRPIVPYTQYTQYMDELIAIAEQSKGKPTRLPPQPSNPLAEMSVSNLDAYWILQRDKTNNQLLLATLALTAFKQEQAHYPQKLDELVPRYLKQIPTDYWADGKPLHYKLGGQKYLLYSVGPDGVDNGGQSISDQKSVDSPNTITNESVGDVVAGVNF